MDTARFLPLFVFTASLTATGGLADSPPQAVQDCSDAAIQAAVEIWEETHPVDPVFADPKAGEERWSSRRALANRLAGACPESYLALWERFLTLPDDLPPKEALDVVMRLVAWHRSADEQQQMLWPTPYPSAVRLLLTEESLGLYDLVPDLVADQQRLDEIRALGSPGRPARVKLRNGYLVAEARIRLDEVDAALVLLEELRPTLEELRSFSQAMDDLETYHRFESTYWRLQGMAAERQDRPADALAHYSRSRQAGEGVESWQEAVTAEQVATLWEKLGGTPDGLLSMTAALKDPAPGQTAWHERDAPLKFHVPFEFQGTDGKTWTLANLAGKTVYINAWATWCSPCRVELPAVQKLYEKLGERESADIALVTLSLDEPEDLRPFLERTGYTFPVLQAPALLAGSEVQGIPRAWILDRDGRVRREQSGFDSKHTADDWVASVLAELEEVASGSAP